jgi:hypothetical protein
MNQNYMGALGQAVHQAVSKKRPKPPMLDIPFVIIGLTHKDSLKKITLHFGTLYILIVHAVVISVLVGNSKVVQCSAGFFCCLSNRIAC